MLLITNTAIHTPGRRIDGGAVLVDAGRIVDVGSAADIDARVRLKPDPTMHVIDASGLNLVPGFIDLQFNGALGHDFTDDPTAIWRVAAQLPRYGVTAFLPTIISSPIGTIAAAQAVVTTGRPAGFRGSAPLGLHLEGPFLNPQKKGAHNPSYLRAPSLHAAAEWSPATGVRLVTLAPELPGALDVVEALSA
ncbi:MAG: amidohydrolase family protein, partial [Acidobacteria bacterium]|nr:amidohydrolase family protein [Acidobacteriota bacterium]